MRQEESPVLIVRDNDDVSCMEFRLLGCLEYGNACMHTNLSAFTDTLIPRLLSPKDFQINKEGSDSL